MIRLALLAGFALASLALPLAATGPVDARTGAAVVFAPWVDEAEAFARVGAAGGALVRAGAFPFIVVAVAEDPSAFARAVAVAGAWAVLDPRALGGCLASPSRPLPPESLS